MSTNFHSVVTTCYVCRHPPCSSPHPPLSLLPMDQAWSGQAPQVPQVPGSQNCGISHLPSSKNKYGFWQLCIYPLSPSHAQCFQLSWSYGGFNTICCAPPSCLPPSRPVGVSEIGAESSDSKPPGTLEVGVQVTRTSHIPWDLSEASQTTLPFWSKWR